MSGNITVVLVHGGFHGPWCWEPVIPGLQWAGLHVVAVDLPMRSLDEDFGIVRDAVSKAKLQGLVCLVGHSYSGQVVNGAGHDADHLVYVAAAVPDQGEAAADVLAEVYSGTPGAMVEGDELRFNNEVMPFMYPCCDVPTRQWAFERMRPMAVACVLTPLPVAPAWQTVPSTYVVCTEDALLPPTYQHARAAMMDRTVELAADHSPFCSATDDLVGAIVATATAGLGPSSVASR